MLKEEPIINKNNDGSLFEKTLIEQRKDIIALQEIEKSKAEI